MKKIAIVFGILFLIYGILVKFGAPAVDNHLNNVSPNKLEAVSPEAQTIYDNLPFIADLHCDALLWNRPIHKRLKRAHVDLPKLQEAKVDLQVFTVVSKSPSGLNFDSNDSKSDQLTMLNIVQARPFKAWFSLKNRVGVQSKALHRLQTKMPDQFKIIKTQADLKALIEANKNEHQFSGGLFGLEGAHPLEGKIENIDYMFEQGTRMIGLVHFFDNEVGGSAHGIEKGGLTEFGKQCIKMFEEKNIIIDLAHASPELAKEVLAMATKPLVVSHTGVQGTCDRGRNLSDEVIKGVAAGGGIIGIGFFEETMCGIDPKLIADGIKYVRDLVGIDFVALGSDYDGSVEVPFNILGLPIIVDELLKQGFTELEIRKVMGENVRDLLLKMLPEN
jgi:microsomal dipeptidase-like Zn-dependent dipeptidase